MAQLGTPTGFQLQSARRSGFTGVWTPVPYATWYEFVVRDKDNAIVYGPTTVTAARAVATGMVADTDYWAYVRAFAPGWDSSAWMTAFQVHTEISGGLSVAFRSGSLEDLWLGDGYIDPNGVQWVLSEMEGWDSPEVETTIIPKIGVDGVWMGPSYYRERVITLQGKIVAPSSYQLAQAMEEMNAKVPLTYRAFWVREATWRSIWVRRSGKLMRRRLTDKIAEYSIMVTADDPVIRSTQEATVQMAPGETKVLVNAGNAPAKAVVRLQGSSTPPVVQPHRTDQPPAAAAPTTGGAEARTPVAPIPLPDLRPGDNSITLPTGAAPVTITYRSAWL